MNNLVFKYVLLNFIVKFVFNYELCPKYTCDRDIGKDVCGKIKTVQNHDTNEVYKEYHLFPCLNHNFKCQISQITENSDGKCIEDIKPKLASRLQTIFKK